MNVADRIKRFEYFEKRPLDFTTSAIFFSSGFSKQNCRSISYLLTPRLPKNTEAAEEERAKDQGKRSSPEFHS
jgi:hypothetical protein